MPTRHTGTPKQPQAEDSRDWYPYHAGFTLAFASRVIQEDLAGTARIIDPWNGAGTTTAAAAALGLQATGIDINPALTVIARGRLSSPPKADDLDAWIREIIALGRSTQRPVAATDPLLTWLRRPSAAALRAIEQGILGISGYANPSSTPLRDMLAAESFSSPSNIVCFLYAALFATARDALTPFRTKNPTWIRYPASHRHRVSPSPDHLAKAFAQRVKYLAARVTSSDDRVEAEIVTGSAFDEADAQVFDGCLTSPPYATRIDYVRSSLAELAVVGLHRDEIASLRAGVLGTPQVRGVRSVDTPTLPRTAESLLKDIRDHDSHGSANYYAPWMRNYLGGLFTSLDRLTKRVVDGGPIAMVVQDSYYKRHHVNLQCIVTEMMAELSRNLLRRNDYPARHLLAHTNPNARRYLAERQNVESLLVFV